MKPEMTPAQIEEKAKRDAAIIAKRQAEIAADIVWWRQQEKIRVEGFSIVQTDPMYIKFNAQYDIRQMWELLC